MTAPVAAVAPRSFAKVTVSAGLAALGCAALAARPALLSSARPALELAIGFGVLLVVGASVPLPSTPVVTARSPRLFAAVCLLGAVAFAAGRAMVGGHAPTPVTLTVIAANTLAAVAEEIWFRRLCYGLFAPAGPVFAVIASSVLFAAVHVSTYGVAVLPLDLAAGALLGWQRAITGSWTAPALTHVLANVLVLL
jgi:membrane protease YdiL (CAAX protease family)